MTTNDPKTTNSEEIQELKDRLAAAEKKIKEVESKQPDDHPRKREQRGPMGRLFGDILW